MFERKHLSYSCWIPLAVIFLMAGCGPAAFGPRLQVEFEGSVRGLQKGDQVYLLGVPVGEISEPFILNGRVIVPVSLQDSKVFGQNSQVLFYIAPDETKPGRQCLVATIHSLPAEAGKPRFRGFASKAKAIVQMSAEKAESWWKSLGISN